MINDGLTPTSISEKLNQFAKAVPIKVSAEFSGRLTRMVGLTLEAVGCNCIVGDRCLIESVSGSPIEAEVVGFDGNKTFHLVLPFILFFSCPKQL